MSHFIELSKGGFDALLEAIEAEKARRAEKMPDEKAALAQMQEAYLRLKELGFNNAIYCPKDGTIFEAVEAGSTGIHECHYHGEWPKGSWWIHGEGDLWPSRPILYRLRATPPTPAASSRPAGAETPEEIARKLVEKEILPPKPGLSAREEISASAHRLYAEDLIAAALRAAEERGAREMRERAIAVVKRHGGSADEQELLAECRDSEVGHVSAAWQIEREIAALPPLPSRSGR